MTAIIEAFLKFFSEFSWKRLLAIVIVATLVAIGFILYERYTSGFRLGRLQKQAELLVTLNQLRTANIHSDPRLGKIYDRLAADADDAAQTKPLTISLLAPPPGMFKHVIAKCLAGAAPWVFVGLFFIPGVVRGDKGSASALLGVSAFVMLFGAIGAVLPNLWWPWFNLWIYPIGHFLLFLILVGVLAVRSGRKQSKSRAAQVA